MFNHSITYNRAANASARAKPIGMMIENCHDDDGWPKGNAPYYGDDGELWCPFHTYRVSGDARPTYGSLLTNLNATRLYAAQNLSLPGCWACESAGQPLASDPRPLPPRLCGPHVPKHRSRPRRCCAALPTLDADMMEVGVTATAGMHDCGESGAEVCQPLTVPEARSHFGAWAIVSSPLVLGFDLRNQTMVDLHWDTITNTDAIEVNQDWAGSSGTQFSQSAENTTLHGCDWKAGVSCEWPRWTAWHKPLSRRDPRGSVAAVLLLNNDHASATLSLELAAVPGLGRGITSCAAYDVWNRKSLGRATTPRWSPPGGATAPHDSVFVTLSDCKPATAARE